MLQRCRWLLGATVAIVILVGLPALALADEPAPITSYAKVSPNGAYVFVMLGNAGRGKETFAGHTVDAWQGYTRSGLYPNDGSKEPLWTVDWYAHKVDVASDGIHLVRHGPWAMESFDEAVTFLANGQPLRTYTIDELIADRRQLPQTVSHFFWLKESVFDDGGLHLEIRTIDGNAFAFDVSTGQIVSESRAGHGD